MLEIFLGTFYRLPTPMNLNYMWNSSSIVGMFLIIQIITGIFLSMHYTNDVTMAFKSLTIVQQDVNFSWQMRFMHSNSASFFLMFIFFHVSRSIYYKRYLSVHAWSVSVVLLILTMLTAFLSYVLPWHQMSFWGATVITNFITVIPYYSNSIVMWLWGGFSVSNPTLVRFYTLHFLMPFIIIVFSLLHLFFIHGVSSSSVLGNFTKTLMIDFWPFFSIKDLLGFFFPLFMYFFFVFFFSDWLSDSENYQTASSLVTPVHIKPEWYFLFAYAILRSIANKKMSVIALVLSLVILFTFVLINTKFTNSFIYMFFFFVWAFNFLFLTWLSGCPVKENFIVMAQISSFYYFFSLFFIFF